MGLFSDSATGDTGRSSATGGNGNVRDSRAADGRHVAELTGHRGAVNDLRTGSSTPGRHRAG